MLLGEVVEADLICALKGSRWIAYLSSYQRVSRICTVFLELYLQAELSDHTKNGMVGMIDCYELGSMNAVPIFSS